MLNKLIENKSKIHTRDIHLTTYPHSESCVIIHGVLKDQRYVRIFDITGEVQDPGIIHHMDVTLLINPDPLRIEDAQARMFQVPLPECCDTLDTIEHLKGLEIKSGFSKQIRSFLGGKNGCTHLSQLVLAMSQEIVHGWLTQRRSGQTVVPRDLASFSEKPFLMDSCRLWAKGGKKLENLEKAIQKNSRKN